MNTSPRRYNIGDTIPGHGYVLNMSSTAYLVVGPDDKQDDPPFWVPFYGPRGVDRPAPVAGLVTFADGSRYGGES